ncbi:hypothetical protein CYMTET_18351 [Cymbomonas tetramitiformis]|uniref:Uncharacterized protein n=1 Tax=Cymbomonas tetramitiformis TaxID=36881 RepID=A0AAE0G8P6_9CHLO|nr:hypothetical protein CYMTET_18351 [Cymbomonas tetramitiformis]
MRTVGLSNIATLWSALDVSLLAGYLCNLELKPLTKSLIDCPTDEDCFYVDLTVKMGFFLAIVAVLTGYVVNVMMAHILHAVKDKRTCIDEHSPLNIDIVFNDELHEIPKTRAKTVLDESIMSQTNSNPNPNSWNHANKILDRLAHKLPYTLCFFELKYNLITMTQLDGRHKRMCEIDEVGTMRSLVI